MQYRTLAQFARWVLAQPLGSLRPPMNATYQYRTGGGVVSSVVLHRDGEFQAELFSSVPTEPVGFFPEHRHPNVDSIEVYLSGQIGFTIRGRRLVTDEQLSTPAEDGTSRAHGSIVRIRPTDYHGATVGPLGGSFLSIQRWLNGIQPTSIGLDWEGPQHIEVRGA